MDDTMREAFGFVVEITSEVDLGPTNEELRILAEGSTSIDQYYKHHKSLSLPGRLNHWNAEFLRIRHFLCFDSDSLRKKRKKTHDEWVYWQRRNRQDDIGRSIDDRKTDRMVIDNSRRLIGANLVETEAEMEWDPDDPKRPQPEPKFYRPPKDTDVVHPPDIESHPIIPFESKRDFIKNSAVAPDLPKPEDLNSHRYKFKELRRRLQDNTDVSNTDRHRMIQDFVEQSLDFQKYVQKLDPSEMRDVAVEVANPTVPQPLSVEEVMSRIELETAFIDRINEAVQRLGLRDKLFGPVPFSQRKLNRKVAKKRKKDLKWGD
ncbi:hypothetical protein HDU96_007379 [Phlyctochytrium bullatum]|nr:hypothetical protein HDU96_007379 [Phlyctochytrium bullatum]